MTPVTSNHVNRHTSWPSCLICENNENVFMRATIKAAFKTAFDQTRSGAFCVVWSWLSVSYPTGSFSPIDGDGTKPFDYIAVGQGHIFSCFIMDIRAVRQNEAGYSKLDLATKHQKRGTLLLHRIIASAFDRSPEVL